MAEHNSAPVDVTADFGEVIEALIERITQQDSRIVALAQEVTGLKRIVASQQGAIQILSKALQLREAMRRQVSEMGPFIVPR